MYYDNFNFITIYIYYRRLHIKLSYIIITFISNFKKLFSQLDMQLYKCFKVMYNRHDTEK